MNAVRHWMVSSPEMSVVIPILDDGTGPLEYFHDVAWVEATSKREAIRLGTPKLTEWASQARSYGLNPFVGVRAELATCEHGVCYCDMCGDRECAACEADQEANQVGAS